MFKYRKLRCKMQKVFWKVVCVFTISLQLNAAVVIKPRPQTANPEQRKFSKNAVYLQSETRRTPTFQQFSIDQTYELPSNIASQQLQPLSRAVKSDNQRPGSESIPTEMFQPVQPISEPPLQLFATQNYVQQRTAVAQSPCNTQDTFEPNNFHSRANQARQSTYTGEITRASLIPEIITNCYNCGGKYVLNTAESARAPTVVHEYHIYSSVPSNGW